MANRIPSRDLPYGTEAYASLAVRGSGEGVTVCLSICDETVAEPEEANATNIVAFCPLSIARAVSLGGDLIYSSVIAETIGDNRTHLVPHVVDAMHAQDEPPGIDLLATTVLAALPVIKAQMQPYIEELAERIEREQQRDTHEAHQWMREQILKLSQDSNDPG